VIFEPLDFLACLAALVPRPRVNLTRFHGVFAPNHRLRAQIVPTARGGNADRVEAHGPARAAGMSWAQRLKRVFGIDIQRCEHCGAAAKIIACPDEAAMQFALAHRPMRELRKGSYPFLNSRG
jgi:hypothetical protein